MKREFNKGGRPVVSEGRKQKYIVCTRLDSEHHFKLKALVRKSGQQPAEIIRQLIGRGWVHERMRREHLDFMAQLKGIARNLNQLTKSAHIGGFGAVVASHAAIITEIEKFLNAMRHDR